MGSVGLLAARLATTGSLGSTNTVLTCAYALRISSTMSLPLLSFTKLPTVPVQVSKGLASLGLCEPQWAKWPFKKFLVNAFVPSAWLSEVRGSGKLRVYPGSDNLSVQQWQQVRV